MKVNRHFLLAGAVAFLIMWGMPSLRSSSAAVDKALRVYVGTYTDKQSKGIYLLHFDPAAGTFDEPKLAGEVANPSFLALHPDQQHLYCVMESNNAVQGFSIDPSSGLLTAINQQPSGGQGPCHLCVDPSGKALLVANYNTGEAAALQIQPDGALRGPTSIIKHAGHSTDPQQSGPHAHEVVFDPAGKFVFEPNLGLDKVFAFTLDASTGKLTANDPAATDLKPGSGPRHIAFDSSGHFAYVVSELASTVTAFRYDPSRGALQTIQTLSMLPPGFEGRHWAAEVAIHPSGKFLYASNRGHGSIATYTRDPQTGQLTYRFDTPTGGEQPRHFTLDPTGRYLIAANQDTSAIVTFAIDPETGALSPAGKPVSVSSPCCVLFAP